MLNIGVQREPIDFIRESLKAGHPKYLLKQIDNDLREAVINMREENHAKTVSNRAEFFKTWLARAVELKSAEQELHSNVAPYLAKILKGKRLLLWKEILVDLNYPDAAVIDEAIQGFSLTGWAKPTGVFRADVRPPNQTLDQLKGSACGLNSAVVGSLKSAEWGELDEQVLLETEEEVSKVVG